MRSAGPASERGQQQGLAKGSLLTPIPGVVSFGGGPARVSPCAAAQTAGTRRSFFKDSGALFRSVFKAQVSAHGDQL